MKIVNPSYDVSFKYFVEDNQVAIDFLSAILRKNIISLTLDPHEIVYTTDEGLRMSKFDFKATIKNDLGVIEKILIEVQRSKNNSKVERFRLYLGQSYVEVERFTNEKGEADSTSYPITSIYFLGFKLKEIEIPFLKVPREYINGLTNEKLTVKDDFIEKLSHDLYAIQIPRLTMEVETELEQMLDLFNEEKYKTNERHVLEYTGDTSNPKVARMVKHLSRALVNNERLMYAILAEEQMEEAWTKEINAKNAEKAAKEAGLIRETAERAAKEQERAAKEASMKREAVERAEKEASMKREAAERAAKEASMKRAEDKDAENQALKNQIELLMQELSKNKPTNGA
jgi:hypothetical protein